MHDDVLERTVTEFNQRHYAAAAAAAGEGCARAEGRDELFWSGLHETCLGFALIMEKQWGRAEAKLAAAIEKLRTFGYRYQNLEVTSVLAGLRQGVEEVRAVREKRKTMFDVTLLPNLKMSAKADDR